MIGKICLDILQNQWSPIYDIAAILTSSKSTNHTTTCFSLHFPHPPPTILISPSKHSHLSFPNHASFIVVQSLLSDPNPASPANAEASQLYERDRREYNKRVRVVVEASWMDDEDAMAMDTKENSNSSHMMDEPSREVGAVAVAGADTAMSVGGAQSSSSSASDSAGFDTSSSSSAGGGIVGVGEGMDSSSSDSSSRAMETEEDGNAGEAAGSTVFTSTEATAAAANG